MTDYPSKEIDCELVIGVVSAVGTEKEQVFELLTDRLEKAGYTVQLVKITTEVIPLLTAIDTSGMNEFDRIEKLMTAGNEAREKSFKKSLLEFDQEEVKAKRYGNSVLALGASVEVFKYRTQQGANDPKPLERTAFIIDSLKRPEEVEQLRLIYPSGFVLVGVHSSQEIRRKHLTGDKDEQMTGEKADQLIARDRDESKQPHGQRLNDTFHLADFFVNVSDSREKLKCDINRIVDLWFGNPFITPTFDEYSMFMAFAASLRSADLSRQVGAVIAKDSQILSTGANECPKPKGGLYWPERNGNCITDEPRGRDYMRGFDSNREQQLDIVQGILNRASDEGIAVGEQLEKLRTILEGSRIKDLTEFGRVVHAEMESILACGRAGISTLDTTMYCTTFPCHNCAKHIVAAGLKRVVYVEPYPKSKALELHDDSIHWTDLGVTSGENRVRFDPFVGIGPRRFFDLFSMQQSSGYDLIRKKKATGEKQPWSIHDSRLRLQMNPLSYIDLEGQANQLFIRIAELNPGRDENP